MIPLDTPVIVATPDYSGPAVVRNRTSRISGALIAYRVETADGDSIVVWPEEIITAANVVPLRRHTVSSFQPEDLPPCA